MRSVLESILDQNPEDLDLVVRVEDWCKRSKTGPGHIHLAALFLDSGKAKWSVNGQGEIDVDGDIVIRNYSGIDRLPDYIQFGTVNGNVSLYNCSGIKSMKGWPREIKGSLSFQDCWGLNNDVFKTSTIEKCRVVHISDCGGGVRTLEGITKECEFIAIFKQDRLVFKGNSLPNGLKEMSISCTGRTSLSGIPQNLERLKLDHVNIEPEELPKGLKSLTIQYVYDYHHTPLKTGDLKPYLSKKCAIIER